jgi:hypothetical protein
MPNSIALAENYAKILDALYKKDSLTANLEVQDEFTQNFNDAGTVQIMSIVTTGLGNYDRTAAEGFPVGTTTVTWDAYTIDNDRGQSFQVDVMDDAEAKKMVFIETVRQFMKQNVIPEIDATRFALMATSGTTPVLAALADGDAYLAAIEAGTLAMDEAEVPDENRILYLSNVGFSLLKTAGTITRNFDVAKDSTINRSVWELDGMPVKKVPVGRFATAITLETGAGDVWGYTLGGTAIHFQIVHEPTVKAITRHAKVRIFDADTNQAADADKYQYRVYHDLIVPVNKTAGVYTHAATA